jgi:small subunit ribosomal protein S1
MQIDVAGANEPARHANDGHTPFCLAGRAAAIASGGGQLGRLARQCPVGRLAGSTHVDHQQDEDFAALFAASAQTMRFERGQTVEGTIVAIGAEISLVDIGSKGEATLATRELTNPDGVVEVAVGDRIQATIISTAGGIGLSRRLQRNAASTGRIDEAFRAGLPIEGRVDAEVKGGFSIDVGGMRAFCPFSQIDLIRGTAPDTHLGRVYTFRVLEFSEGGRKFVVSRRVLLESEQQERARQVRRSLQIGDVVTGRVASVRDFGAFIELGGGVQGLLHVSEMSWSHVTTPSSVVAAGQDVTVKVLRIDEGSGQIALGLRQLLADPWQAVPTLFATGQVYQGSVERHAPFGVFVALAPGVVGLLPAAEADLPRDADLRKALPSGTTVTVVVEEIDTVQRRIRLSRTAVARVQEASDVEAYTQRESGGGRGGAFGGSLADKLRGALTRRPS